MLDLSEIVQTPKMNSSKSGDRRVRQNKSSDSSARSVKPPQFDSTIRIKHRFRFSTTSQTTVNITRGNLLNLLIEGGSSTTTNHRVISGVKLNRVECWAVSGNSSTDYGFTTVSLEWLSNYGPSKEVSDSGNSFNTAHIAAVPPPQSLASFWSLTGSSESEILMSLTSPNGAIWDVWVEMVMYDGETPVAITTTATPTFGALYAGYLDGQVSGTYLPVSYVGIN